MKLLLLCLLFAFYRSTRARSEPSPRPPHPLQSDAIEPEEVVTAQPFNLENLIKGIVSVVSEPRKPVNGGRPIILKELGEDARHTAGEKKKPEVAILPMPIAVGEPNPNGAQKPADFSLDGYFYQGTKKIASYRIDFKGVHFKKGVKGEKPQKPDEMVDPLPPKKDDAEIEIDELPINKDEGEILIDEIFHPKPAGDKELVDPRPERPELIDTKPAGDKELVDPRPEKPVWGEHVDPFDPTTKIPGDGKTTESATKTTEEHCITATVNVTEDSASKTTEAVLITAKVNSSVTEESVQKTTEAVKSTPEEAKGAVTAEPVGKTTEAVLITDKVNDPTHADNENSVKEVHTSAQPKEDKASTPPDGNGAEQEVYTSAPPTPKEVKVDGIGLVSLRPTPKEAKENTDDKTVSAGKTTEAVPVEVTEVQNTPVDGEPEQKTTVKAAEGAHTTAAPEEGKKSTESPKEEHPTETKPEGVHSTAAPVEGKKSTEAPEPKPEGVHTTAAPAEGKKSTEAPNEKPEKVASTASTPAAPVASEASKSTPAPGVKDEPVLSAAPATGSSSVPVTGAPLTGPVPVYTGTPPKYEIKEGEKCTDAVEFTWHKEARRCFAKHTDVCNDKDWERVLSKTFGQCMKTAPREAPADEIDVTDCGLGKVYAQVPGEPSALLFGHRCNDHFCPKEGTCVQGTKLTAHCCIMPNWAHYGK